jgi:cation:H+ antiporter
VLIISLEFLVLAAVVVVAGTCLAKSCDQIAEITGLGRLLIGSVLLASVTSLPELTVDLSAVRLGMPDLATGDLLGSSLMNLLILAALDLLHRNGGKMLSREASAHALSATLSIALTGLVGLGILTASRLQAAAVFEIGMWSWVILTAYLLGVRMVFIDQRISVRAAIEAQEHAAVEHRPSVPMWKPATVFVIAAVALCFAGPRLAHVAGQLADRSGWGKTFVGTTLVALSTSLPELVASIAALRMKAFDLVVGNVFGSNAFNMILFVPLDAAFPGPIFAAVSPSHGVTVLAVIVATATAVAGQLYRVEKRYRIIEPDALLMILMLLGALWIVYRLA